MPNTYAQRLRLLQLLGALDGTATDVDDVVNDLVQTDLAIGFLHIPITAFTDGGGPQIAFNDGVANGLALVDSECVGHRFNPVGEDTSVLSTSVALPQNLNAASNVVVHMLAFRVGAADTTAVIDVGAFFQVAGSAHTADADAGGATAALAAATTIVTEYTVTLAAADVPEPPCSLTLTLAPDAALDADDLVITAVWLEFALDVTTD